MRFFRFATRSNNGELFVRSIPFINSADTQSKSKISAPSSGRFASGECGREPRHREFISRAAAAAAAASVAAVAVAVGVGGGWWVVAMAVAAPSTPRILLRRYTQSMPK